MNIILSMITALFTVYYLMKYRPTGKQARDMFVLCLAASVLMLFTSHTFFNVWSWMVTLLDIAVCVFMVSLFRAAALDEILERKYAARAAERTVREKAEAVEEARLRRARDVSFPARRKTDSGRFAA